MVSIVDFMVVNPFEVFALGIIRRYHRSGCSGVLFSGGRDSLVLLHLFTRVVDPNEFRVIITYLPGNVSPVTQEYVESICKEWGLQCYVVYPCVDFWELLEDKGMSHVFRLPWCRQLKYRAWREAAKRLGIAVYFSGVKQGDSVKRRRVLRSPVQYNPLVGKHIVSPLFNWSRADVYSYIKRYNLRLNPEYERIGHSGNCLWCPFLNKKSLKKTIEAYPMLETRLRELLISPPSSERNKYGIKGSIITYEKISVVLNRIDPVYDIDCENILSDPSISALYPVLTCKDNEIIIRQVN